MPPRRPAKKFMAPESSNSDLSEYDSDDNSSPSVATSFESQASVGHPRGYGKSPSKKTGKGSMAGGKSHPSSQASVVRKSPRNVKRNNATPAKGRPSHSKRASPRSPSGEAQSPRRGRPSQVRQAESPRKGRPGHSRQAESPPRGRPSQVRQAESPHEGRPGHSRQAESPHKGRPGHSRQAESSMIKSPSQSRRDKGEHEDRLRQSKGPESPHRGKRIQPRQADIPHREETDHSGLDKSPQREGSSRDEMTERERATPSTSKASSSRGANISNTFHHYSSGTESATRSRNNPWNPRGSDHDSDSPDETGRYGSNKRPNPDGKDDEGIADAIRRRIVNRDRSSQQVQPSAGERRKRRAKPGTKALQEIKKYQRSTNLLLSKLPFSRLVRELCDERMRGIRWTATALEALQEAAEIYLVHLFEDSLLCTLHRGRVTLDIRDMRLARRLRSRID